MVELSQLALTKTHTDRTPSLDAPLQYHTSRVEGLGYGT